MGSGTVQQQWYALLHKHRRPAAALGALGALAAVFICLLAVYLGDIDSSESAAPAPIISAVPATTAAPSTTTTTEPPPPPPWATVERLTVVTEVDPLRGHPGANRWVSQVAWVLPATTEVEVFKARPATADLVQVASSSTDLPTIAAIPNPNLAISPVGRPNALTPIPSPNISWGSNDAGTSWRFTNPTPAANPLVFLVLEEHGDWLRVLAPLRPLQQSGWIRADQVEIRTHEYHIEVNLTHNRLRAWDGDDLIVDTGSVDGVSYTPTPVGRFYISEMQDSAPTSGTGSHIMATNAFSEAHEVFSGSAPIVAIHGTSWDTSMGMDISNGCIRVPNSIIDILADRLPPGTPVDISY